MEQTLLDRLRGVLAAGPRLRFAILFGSRARGRARPDSDIDVAILPEDSALSLMEEHTLAAELERVAGAPVDLVRIDHAPAALKWRIARDAVVLSSSPPAAAIRFLAGAGIEHDEVLDLEIEAMRLFRARLAAPAAGPSR